MWRPENWKETVFRTTYFNVSTEIYSEQEVNLGRKFFAEGMEVSADAMLKAIVEELEKCYTIKGSDTFFWNPQMVRKLIDNLKEK